MSIGGPREQRPSAPPARRGRPVGARVTRVTVETDRGVFMISVAAALANMHPQTLRMYEARELIEPQRSPKGTRLYSQEDVEKLKRIQEMTADLGLNLAGVERVLRLEDELARMERRLARLEAQMRESIAEVHRTYRRDLVLYRPEQGIVPRRQ